MKTLSTFFALTAAVCLTAFAPGVPALAGEITVVAGGGPLPDVMGTLLPMFEKATGNTVKFSSRGAPAITSDIKSGAADVVITNTDDVDKLAQSGDVAANGNTLLMISKVGIAVKAGAPHPDVSTPDKLKAALMAAKSVGYSQGSSGRHMQTVFQKLGITGAIKGKAVVVQGRPVGAAIASGEAQIGFQQVAELRPVKGVDQFAELPAALQTKIPYSAGISAKAKDAATARALVNFLRSPAARDVLKRKGMDLP
ncbi:MAG TPA: molybdate ABC transporter substrate-binding protein [Micropepsaceae bacterium]|nr:molybdate ABC transporter substrate-binding protein [Micropepsaceae bacterium]